jgi:protein involved in polysaccharide export with SLBB domain
MKLKFLFLAIITFFLFQAVPAQSLPPAPPPSKGYLLWPGDEITAKVIGESDYDFVATVNEEGKIEVPFSDKAIVAKCKTERELKTDVTELLGKYLRSPQLNLRITDRKSRPPAIISGEVMQSGNRPMRKATPSSFFPLREEPRKRPADRPGFSHSAADMLRCNEDSN